MQNYARKKALSIDTITWACSVMEAAHSSIVEPPPDGCYIYGLFMEGARWDPDARALAEARPKVLYETFPLIWLNPQPDRVPPKSGERSTCIAGMHKRTTQPERRPHAKLHSRPCTSAFTGVYMCPVYKTLLRAGALSTTGHSTNFVLYLDLPSQEACNGIYSQYAETYSPHWIKRSVALFCSLNY